MENIPEIKRIELEEGTLRDLDTTRKWSMFMAILGFIAVGILIIVGLVAGVFLSVFKTEQTASWGIIPASVVLGFSIIYFFPILCLYSFSKHAGHAVRELDKDHLRKAFKYLKRYFIYVGIVAIVVLAFYLIAFIVSGASLAFLKDFGTGI